LPLRLYFDNDSLNRAVVSGLRGVGIDVLTTEEASRQRASDTEQLAFATWEQRMIFTADRADYTRLHGQWMRAGRTHAGIIVRINQQLAIGQQIRALRAICDNLVPEDAANRLEFLENWLLSDT
jgi:predicted nuclease of predicted toxin-antitoxin system